MRQRVEGPSRRLSAVEAGSGAQGPPRAATSTERSEPLQHATLRLQPARRLQVQGAAQKKTNKPFECLIIMTEDMPSKPQEVVNPIDRDKVADNPGLLQYAHSVGGAIIRPLDKGRTRGQAMEAMYQQTAVHLTQIKQQVEVLMAQAAAIHNRLDISERIYKADIPFKPVIGHLYHLYRRDDGSYVLSLVGPEEWIRQRPFTFVASVKLLADHTWDIVAGEPDL